MSNADFSSTHENTPCPETVASQRALGAFETYSLKGTGAVLVTGRAVGEKIASAVRTEAVKARLLLDCDRAIRTMHRHGVRRVRGCCEEEQHARAQTRECRDVRARRVAAQEAAQRRDTPGYLRSGSTKVPVPRCVHTENRCRFRRTPKMAARRVRSLAST